MYLLVVERAPDPKTDRKADSVARDLLEKIVRGELAPGTILPREDELAVAHGVNRSVIREAIKNLEVHRLVRPVRRRGTEVLDPLASLSPEVLRVMLTPAPGKIDRPTLVGLLDIRTALDVLMVGQAADRRGRQDLLELDRRLQAMRDAQREPQRYARAMDDFDAAVARATGNPVFPMLVAWHRVAASHLEHVFAAIRPASDLHTAKIAELVELIRARDVPGARKLAERFHGWATPRVLAAAELASVDQVAPSRPRKRA
jgi:DNA-binding FadR family transcriptional regulator